jgi:AraC family ethanolamine operon transcriptional activator
MDDRESAPFRALRTFRFSDIDHFRSSIHNLSVDFTPLARTISAEQVILNLGGCDVNFTKSFPRIIDAQFDPQCTVVALMMDDGPPVRFNGVEREDSIIAIGGGGSVYSSVETAPRQYVSIVFSPEVEDRGWPRPGANFHLFETKPDAYYALRRLVLRILSTASELPDFAAAGDIAASMRESLLAAIDAAVAGAVPGRWTEHANSLRHFKIFRDIEEALASQVGDVIYSADLAAKIGVSVRTMHEAVQRYRGMSLHRYLRLRRLWLVRRRLVAGAESVKAAALAYGFWHLGDFAHNYREQFGETPSETLAKSHTH